MVTEVEYIHTLSFGVPRALRLIRADAPAQKEVPNQLRGLMQVNSWCEEPVLQSPATVRRALGISIRSGRALGSDVRTAEGSDRFCPLYLPFNHFAS